MSEQTPTPRNIRTWADWEQALEAGDTTAAERELVAACRAGEDCTLGDGTRPTAPSDDRTVGADLLRYLIIGGCDGCPDLHESGVALSGAYIAEMLNLMYCTAVGMTRLVHCHFDKGIEAEQARLQLLNLEGSQCHTLNAEGAEVKGDVFLRSRFTAKGEVSLAGAEIGGQLDCTDGSFENEKEKEKALNAQGAEVKGDVFLSDDFSAKGEVSLAGAQIGGQLSCTGGSFENEKEKEKALNAQGAEVKGDVFLSDDFSAKGEVSLAGAQIGGQLACDDSTFENGDGSALNAQDTRIASFYWRDLKAVSGEINLAGARTGDLSDDAASWDMANRLYLDGFEYSSIHGPLDAPMRLAWLAKACAYDGSFSPQPYEQLAHVLKKMGHEQTARQILVSKEIIHRQSERANLRFKRRLGRLVARLSKRQTEERAAAVNDYAKNAGSAEALFVTRLFDRFRLFHVSWPASQEDKTHPAEIARAQEGFCEEIFWQNGRIRRQMAWLHLKDRMARHLVGYGYRPFNFIWALALLIGVGWLFAHQAYEHGDFAPNSDVILSTQDWQTLAEGKSANPAADWASQTGKGRDYETFNSFAYAIDVVIPIVAIGQEAAWAPSTTRGPWGHALWWLRWVLTLLGWIVTAVGAAAITGIIRRE